MKLASKLILIFMVGVLGIVALFSWQTIQRQRQWSQQLHEESAVDLVDALRPTIEQAYREGGFVRIQQAVEVTQRTTQRSALRWLEPEATQSPVEHPELAAPVTQTDSRTTSSISITGKDGNTNHYTYVPMTIDGVNPGTLEVEKPILHSKENLHRSVLASLWSLLGVAALSGIVIYWGGLKLVAGPMGKLMQQVEKIGNGEFAQPPALTSNDELGQLALAISNMSHRLQQQRETIATETEAKLQTEQKLRHIDRLGTVGTLAAGVAHELGTPLNVVSGRASLISGGQLSVEEIKASANTIQQEAGRMTAIIRQLLDFARRTGTEQTSINLNVLVKQTCELMQPLSKKSNVQLIAETSSNTPVTTLGDLGQLQQVMTNLIGNAIQAMPEGGSITIKVRTEELQPPAIVDSSAKRFACLEVVDTGVGMTDAETEHVFEPFYTTKDVGEGTGLGLSIAYGIVREHGGWIDVESEKKKGTTFRVWLPYSDQEESR